MTAVAASEAARPRQTLEVLQAGRGLAALLVVFFHANTLFAADKYWGDELWSGFRMGHSGVDFFFVLSGFIIAHIHMGDVGRPERLGRFALKRLVRIYPVYWVALALMVAPLFVSAGFEPDASRSPIDILASAALWPTAESPHLKVAWTLRHEMLFYLLFASLLWARKAGLVLLGLWFGGCAIWTLIGTDVFPAAFFFSTYNLLFLFGMASAWLLGRVRIPHAAWVATGGVLVFALSGWLDVAYGESRVLTLAYGVGATLAILGFVELERSRGLRTPPALKVLGDASYSIYLIHYLALSAGAKLAFALGIAAVLPTPVAYLGMVVGATAVGLVFRWGIEKPLVEGLGRRFIPRASGRTASPVA